jgi:lysozyme family protein
MAHFKTAYALTMGHEGIYSNNPKDRGGETYKGIARKFHPSWEGWKAIDRMKNKPG